MRVKKEIIKKKKKEVEICVLECIQNFIGVGRLHPGSEEICFEVGTRYYFILERKKGEIFTIDETKNIHFFNINDEEIDHYFYSISSGFLKNYDLDEVTKKRLEKLHKERHSYSE